MILASSIAYRTLECPLNAAGAFLHGVAVRPVLLMGWTKSQISNSEYEETESR